MIDLLDLIDLASYKTAPAKFMGCSKTQLNQGSSFTIAYYIKSYICKLIFGRLCLADTFA